MAQFKSATPGATASAAPAMAARPARDRIAAILDRWPALTYEDIEIAGDDPGLLAVRVVERYGISLEWACRQVLAWAAGGAAAGNAGIDGA